MSTNQRPLVFLDFDDVIWVDDGKSDGTSGAKYGGHDAIGSNPPADLWENLFHAPAVDVLRKVSDEFSPAFVITTSWLQFVHPEGMVQILQRSGLAFVANNLHAQPEAPFTRGRTRADAITTWLAANHRGEPYVILDDKMSGTGLDEPNWRKNGRVVLCDVNVGLLPTHALAIRRALTTPFKRRTR